MFADIMNLDNLRRNIWEFEDIIEKKTLMAKRSWLKTLFLYHYIEGILVENEILTLPLSLSRDGRADPVLSRTLMCRPLSISRL